MALAVAWAAVSPHQPGAGSRALSHGGERGLLRPSAPGHPLRSLRSASPSVGCLGFAKGAASP